MGALANFKYKAHGGGAVSDFSLTESHPRLGSFQSSPEGRAVLYQAVMCRSETSWLEDPVL